MPLLSNLPVVGGLFGATTSTSGRTELLVVITPRVVRTDPEIREVSEDLRERLRGLRKLDLPQTGADPVAPTLQGVPSVAPN